MQQLPMVYLNSDNLQVDSDITKKIYEKKEEERNTFCCKMLVPFSNQCTPIRKEEMQSCFGSEQACVPLS